jgi:hypothetical protein
MGNVFGVAEQSPSNSAPSAGFDAFLSYTQRDRLVANGIQRGLHQIGRRAGQLRALRVFRDDTNLEVSPDLWGRITDAMGRSRFLIVVLSPVAAQSVWVNREVSHWLDSRGRDHLLFVLAAGRLLWDVDRACFDRKRPTLPSAATLVTGPVGPGAEAASGCDAVTHAPRRALTCSAVNRA